MMLITTSPSQLFQTILSTFEGSPVWQHHFSCSDSYVDAQGELQVWANDHPLRVRYEPGSMDTLLPGQLLLRMLRDLGDDE